MSLPWAKLRPNTGSASSLPQTLALADALEKADAGGDGDIQAFDLPGHGDLGQEVAVLAGEAAHAGPLCADDDADGAFQIQLVETLGCLIPGADEPEAKLLELAHGAGKVRHAHQGDVFRAPACHADDGFTDGGGLVLGHDDHGHAGGICGAQAGTEVVRVLHTVEDEDQRVFFSLHQRGHVALVIGADVVIRAGMTVLAGNVLVLAGRAALPGGRRVWAGGAHE